MSMRSLALTRMRLRMVQRELVDRCTIEKQGDAEGEHGEPLNEWAVVATDVSCRIIRAGTSMSSSNSTVGGRENLVDKLRIILPYEQVVAADYRIEMADGRRYEVVDVVDDLTDKTFTQCIVERLRDKNG